VTANKFLIAWAAALMIGGTSLANSDLHQRTKIAWWETDPIVQIAPTPRSRAAVREFRRRNLCPSTGRFDGVCPGYVVDHVIALCVGGEDYWTNMQWQTIEEAKEKDRWECDDHWRLVGRR
jgi:hypothetical protein